MFAMGVEGWVAAPSNVIARYCAALFRLAVEERNFSAARQLYTRLLPLFAMFEGTGQYVQLNKAGLALLGRPIGDPRPPLLPPAETQVAQLKTILNAIYVD
jgi:4-hydroxy-tetrahydrodipicolinate synthase